MAAPPSTRLKVRRRIMDVSDNNPLLGDDEALDEAIAQAVTRYSQDRPREVVDDVTGNGANVRPLTGASKIVASWADGLSRIVSIDYPAEAVSGDFTATWLDPDTDWSTYKDETLVYVRLPNHTPSASETMRLTYTALHTHTVTSDTVPSVDLDALCDLAAHYCCQALATKAAGSQDSVIAADSTNYRDSQLRYRQQAEDWLKSYRERMGIPVGKDGSSGVQGASATADWNRSNTVGGPFLTHSNRWGR